MYLVKARGKNGIHVAEDEPSAATARAAIVASLITIPLPQPADWTVPASLFAGYGLGVFLLGLGGLSATGMRGFALLGPALRGALFLSHWLVVVPWALLRIAFLPASSDFVQTPRFTRPA